MKNIITWKDYLIDFLFFAVPILTFNSKFGADNAVWMFLFVIIGFLFAALRRATTKDDEEDSVEKE